MRVAFFEVEEWGEEYLKDKLGGHLCTFSQEKLNLQSAQQVKEYRL